MIAAARAIRNAAVCANIALRFSRVGLSGADMGACAMLPRIIGHGRASELLYTGRFMSGAEAERWGFYNRLAEPATLLADAQALARTLAEGPTLAHAATKRALHEEWDMGIDDAIDYEAEVQAELMQSEDFARAYRAFVAKETPVFEGD